MKISIFLLFIFLVPLTDVSALTINTVENGFDITASNYTAYIDNSGRLTELKADNSSWDLIGSDFKNDYRGVYLYNDSEVLNATYKNNLSASIEFRTPETNWTYIFTESNFSINITLSSSASDTSLFVPFDITYIQYANETGTSDTEDLTDGLGVNKMWKEITLTTVEYVRLSLSLKDHPIGTTEGQVDWHDNMFIWGLNNLWEPLGGDPMTFGNSYEVIFNIDLTDFNQIKDNTEIQYVDGKYSIASKEYSAVLNNNSILEDFYVNGSSWDLLGYDLYQDKKGIYLTDSTLDIMTATSSVLSNNKIFFNTDRGHIEYIFTDAGIDIISVLDSPDNTNLFSVFDIAYFNEVNETDTANNKNLSGHIGIDAAWPEITLTTIENSELSISLKDHPVSATEGQIDWHDGILYWGLQNEWANNGGNPMTTGTYKVMLRVDNSQFQKIDDNIQISIEPEGINITAPEYDAFVRNDSVLDALFVKNSIWDLMGNEFVPKFDGLFFQNGTLDHLSALNYVVIDNRVIFNFSFGTVEYDFKESGIGIFVRLKGTSGDVDLIFAPDIDFLKSVSQKDTSNIEDLTDQEGITAQWPETTFTTFEDIDITIYLNDHPIGNTEGQVDFVDGVQVWGLNNEWSLNQGNPMHAGGEYLIQIDIDAKNYMQKISNTKIITTPDGYNVSSKRYNISINDKCHAIELYIDDSDKNVFANDTDVKGIFMENLTGTMIDATSSVISSNRIVCHSDVGVWKYTFYDRDFDVTVNLYDSVGDVLFFVSGNVSNLISMNETNTTNHEDLSDNIGLSAAWKEVSFTTVDLDIFSIKLRNHPVGTTEGRVDWENNIQYWGLQDKWDVGGAPMVEGGTYVIEFKTNPMVREIYNFTYIRSYDGDFGKGTYQLPAGMEVAPLPLVICLHGYRSTAEDCFKSDLDEIIDEKNWLMVSPEGYGRNENYSFHEGMDLGWFNIESEIRDVIDYMDAISSVDHDRIYLVSLGNSDLSLVARNPSLFAAVVSWFGVTDLLQWTDDLNDGNIGSLLYGTYNEQQVGGTTIAYPFEYKRRSAIEFYTNFRHIPIKLFHPENDTEVNHTQSSSFFSDITTINPYAELDTNNTGHCAGCINGTKTIDWLERFTRPALETILNISIITDVSRVYYWAKIFMVDENPFGPDAGDTSDYFSSTNISINLTENSVIMDTINTSHILFNISATTINASQDMSLNISHDYAETFLLEFYRNNTILNLSLDDTFGQIIVDDFLIPKIVDMHNWSFSYSDLYTRPVINESYYPLLNSSWNVTESRYNFSLNVTEDNQRVIIYMPHGFYEYGYEINNISNRLFVGENDTIINLTLNVSYGYDFVLQNETILPEITYVLPTPENASTFNQSALYVNVSLSEMPSVCVLSIGNVTAINYTMNIANMTCNYNLSTILDNTWYNYDVFVTDLVGNMNSTGNRTVYVNYNNAPIIIGNLDQSVLEDALSWTINISSNATDADNDTLTWTSDDTNATFSGTDLTFSYPADWYGSELIGLTVNDSILSDTVIINVTVLPVNDAPIITSMPNITVDEDAYNDSVDLDDYVSDVDNNVLGINWTAINSTNISVIIDQTT
ncbi:MAG: hypothetical protein GQ477_01660, partial [Nanohaloarchaea archaeon]|nr:hypothetical protein [Candidatus Nanohaloarchaea archaeon]